LLAVGPKSAGAEPGPACYGRGGELPTVTDAQYVLGYLDPAFFEAGELDFDGDAARAALEKRVARPLGLNLVEAASGVYDIVNSNMAAAIGVVSVQRGYDPREFVLVVAGGAGPIHAAPIARELQIPLILIPRASSVFCAAGMLISDLKHDYVRTYARDFYQIQPDEIRKMLAEMTATARQTLKAEHVQTSRIEVVYSADLRYVGQFNEVEVPLPPGGRITRTGLDRMAEDFHARHDGLFGYSMRGAPLELINLRVTARGKTEKPKLDRFKPTGASAAHARTGKRRAYFSGRFHEVPVYDGLKLDAGNKVAGPAIVVQRTTTIIVPPDFDLLCDEFRNYLMFGKGKNVGRLCKALR
jgi:N-methylhydantoinase A